MENSKAVFSVHVDRKGRLQDGKEIFDCPHCNGQCYEVESSVTPSGIQHFTYHCTDCEQTWNETY